MSPTSLHSVAVRRRHRLALAALLGLCVAAPLAAAPVYSTHPPFTGKTRAVPVFIDAGFSSAEQEQIASALDEWNRALNGVARFDRVATANDTVEGNRAWLIRRGAGKEGIREPGRKAQNLATVQPLAKSGGILIVFAGANEYMRENGLNLRDVMMRELGHLVGLRHATSGDLLSKDYLAGDRSCVDRETATEVASAMGVPAEALNWCEPAKP